MNDFGLENKEKTRKDRAKQAVAFAMKSRWEEAVLVNRAILQDFPDDLEAYNRLGKGLSELGRNREAKESFQRALELSPYNSIAKKNLERLIRLGDDGSAPRVAASGSATSHNFVEESGKAGKTTLINLAASNLLLQLAPGHAVKMSIESKRLKIDNSLGEYVGQIEPRLASRLIKLINGGNQYDAAVTSVGERELTIIIRETYKHPAQSGIVSFPSRSLGVPVPVASSILELEGSEQDMDDQESASVKDWSDDDTEPGDDDAFTPVLHRIISANDEINSEDEEF